MGLVLALLVLVLVFRQAQPPLFQVMLKSSSSQGELRFFQVGELALLLLQ